jgi:hypothetical protein
MVSGGNGANEGTNNKAHLGLHENDSSNCCSHPFSGVLNRSTRQAEVS